MIFICAKKTLLDNLSVILRGVSTRSSLPILTGIWVGLKDNTLKMVSTDLEITLAHRFEVNGQEDGKCIFPARLLFEIIRNLPEEEVMIKTIEDKSAEINCSSINYNINLLNIDDWPDIDLKEEKADIDIPLEALEKGVRKVSRSASKDETRRVLTGILFSIKNKEINMVATDSYRLAISKQIINEDIKEEIKIIIPSRVLEEVVKVCGLINCDQIKIKFSDNQVIFYCDNTVIRSRLIEGQYPDYQKLIPQQSEIKLPLEKSALSDAVKRMTVLTRDKSPLLFSMKKDEIEVGVQSSGVGKANEIIKTDYDGREEQIAFNGQYFLDGINNGDNEMILEINDSQKPGVLKNKDTDDYLYLIMPIRV